MDWTNKHLGRPFVPRWIYGDVAPHNEELDETIRAVEQALGFKLFVWAESLYQAGRVPTNGSNHSANLA